MQDKSGWSYDTFIAAAAFLISLVSLYFSAQANARGARQEKRKEPKLVPVLLNAFVRSGDAKRAHIYAFNISVSNPTDSDNAIADFKFRLAYLTKSGVETNIKIEPGAPDTNQFLPENRKSLSAPVRISAHDTVSGWIYFPVEAQLVETARIESYKIILIDTHGVESFIEPIMIQEYRDDIRDKIR